MYKMELSVRDPRTLALAMRRTEFWRSGGCVGQLRGEDGRLRAGAMSFFTWAASAAHTRFARAASTARTRDNEHGTL